MDNTSFSTEDNYLNLHGLQHYHDKVVRPLMRGTVYKRVTTSEMISLIDSDLLEDGVQYIVIDKPIVSSDGISNGIIETPINKDGSIQEDYYDIEWEFFQRKVTMIHPDRSITEQTFNKDGELIKFRKVSFENNKIRDEVIS